MGNFNNNLLNRDLSLANGICGENVTWNIENDTLIITGIGEMDNYISPWYGYRKHIKNVIIDKGVTAIGKYAFYHCDEMESITLPDTLKRIGEYAFIGCNALHDINIPKTLKYIEPNAFKDCDAYKAAIKRARFLNKLRLRRRYPA